MYPEECSRIIAELKKDNKKSTKITIRNTPNKLNNLNVIKLKNKHINVDVINENDFEIILKEVVNTWKSFYGICCINKINF